MPPIQIVVPKVEPRVATVFTAVEEKDSSERHKVGSARMKPSRYA
jgi:hypothetical protein